MKSPLLSALLGLALVASAAGRETDFNAGWRFVLGNPVGAETTGFDDAAWREVRLPHDWSVEFPFDGERGEGATGYLPGGIGWYRKTFTVPEADRDKLVFVNFDGIYNNAEVWLNGVKLGSRPYGYVAFTHDLTPHLRPSAPNVLAVRVDRTRFADSRWYPGSGIYRHVRLVTVDRLHVPVWGTFVTTPELSVAEAQVAVTIQVRNARAGAATFELATEILDPAGRSVARAVETHTLAAAAEAVFDQRLHVAQPALWDLDHPRLHRAVTTITQVGRPVDRSVTPFGIRSFRFDADTGFFLNGVNLKIKGVCLHHDGGLVGAAVPEGVWRRRLAALKEAGCNAIRISHNPPSAEFLDLCDELGFLVQNEFFDEWDYPKDKRLNKWETMVDHATRGYGEHFQAWAERDLKDTMRRDRNHPSIIQWSIGNEIEWTYPAYSKATGFFEMTWQGNYFWSTPPNPPEVIRRIVRAEDNREHTMAGTAAKLADWTRQMDPTRPVVLNSILPSASHESGVADVLDILGYSYRRVVYDYGHRLYPGKVIMGTENLPQWHEWKAVMERPFISGTFLWTGIDYLGEANNQWPRKGTRSGLLDTAGFKKTSWHMFRTLWKDAPHVHLVTQRVEKSAYQTDPATGAVVEKKPGAWERALWFWPEVNRHWNYAVGEPVIVEAYSNCPELELFLNGVSLGVRRLADFPDRIYKWAVPYAAGELTVRGAKDGGVVSAQLVTSGAPVAVTLTADRDRLAADAADVVHVIAQLVDAAGRPVRDQERRIDFAVTGTARVLGVDTGASDNTQTYQANTLVTHEGRGLLIIQSTTAAAAVTITANGEGLQPGSVKVIIQ